MAQLFLPLAHTDADLVLAGLIAERIDSAELYVAWTPEQGRAVPEVMAELRAAAPALTALALLAAAARELWAVLRGRRPRPEALAAPAERPARQAKPAA